MTVFVYQYSSIVRKLVRPNFRRSTKEYFSLYRSHKPMRVNLTQKQINYIIRQCRKGSSTSHIATEIKISQRRVQQLWSMYRVTGKIPTLQMPGKLRTLPTEEQTNVVLAAHRVMPAGVARITKYLNHKGIQISEKMVYTVMKENNMVIPSAAKSRRRKWIRYERRYSNAMWHTNWHTMKDPRFQGYQLITYLDDASSAWLGP